jgi:hypothetical protein
MKPREWWIDDGSRTQCGDGLAVFPNNWQSPAFTKPEYGPDRPFVRPQNIFHVIEKSAYDELKAENGRLKRDNLLALDIAKKFADERDDLKAALEQYADENNWTVNAADNGFGCDYGQKAREALKRWSGE